MRKKVTFIGVALIIFHALSEAHSLLAVWDKKVAQTAIDLFVSPFYEMLLQIQWYLKQNFDSLLVLVTYYILIWTALKVSRRLFFIVSVWFAYHIIDLYLFWWNYKTTYWVYWSMLIVFGIQTIILIIPIKEKAKVVSME